jgi:hypothetical protein
MTGMDGLFLGVFMERFENKKKEDFGNFFKKFCEF